MAKSLARVALLTNFLGIFRVPLLENLAQNVGQLRVFLSVPMEGNRSWPVFWGLLDVVVHRSITIERKFRNAQGYTDQTFTHIPYDTLPLLWSYRPDVVVTSELGVRSLIARLYKLLRPSTKLIVWATLSERTEESRGAIRWMLRRWLLRRTDAVYVNGASGARYIRSLGYCGLISIIPYVVDNCAFLDPGIRRREDTLRLLYTGQLIERKGLNLFLQQLSRWCSAHQEKSVSLSVVGSGEQLDELKRIELPSNLQIDFKGSMGFEQLPSEYHSAELYVYPTLADEWGLVVNEAMIAGLPVLGSRFSQAVEELVVDGVNGWIFTPTDEQDTYNAIERALKTDSRTLETMSNSAVSAVAALTPNAVAKLMSETIIQALDAKPA